jgi:hypothetical protein
MTYGPKGTENPLVSGYFLRKIGKEIDTRMNAASVPMFVTDPTEFIFEKAATIAIRIPRMPVDSAGVRKNSHFYNHCRFEYYDRLERKVHIDGSIEVGRAYYSAPPLYVGQKIIVHVSDLFVRLIDPKTQMLIREHPRALNRGQRSMHTADQPKVTPPSVLALVDRAEELGKDIGHFAVRVEKMRGSEAARSFLSKRWLIQPLQIV